jgi:DNA repair photolyase
MHIGEIQAKSILTRSKLPDVDYVANPYVGCQFGCVYCYATFMGRFVGEPRDNWGQYVYIKVNAVELAREQLSRWGGKRRRSRILLSSVTDPYQGVEKRFRLARGILEALVESGYPGQVSVLTKSPLVLRDVDLLRQLPQAEVGLTVTTRGRADGHHNRQRAQPHPRSPRPAVQPQARHSQRTVCSQHPNLRLCRPPTASLSVPA